MTFHKEARLSYWQMTLWGVSRRKRALVFQGFFFSVLSILLDAAVDSAILIASSQRVQHRCPTGAPAGKRARAFGKQGRLRRLCDHHRVYKAARP
jgi:hypothetical protein